MKDGVLDFSDTIYIDEAAHKLLWKSEVKPNTILLSMSGTIGDVAIAMPDYKYPMNSNQDIAKITLRGGLNPFYLYAFLRSKYGQNFLLREARGSVQQHVFLSQMENIKVSLLSDSFQSHIEQIVKSAHAKLSDSKSLYSEAEEILLSELGLKNWQPSSTAVNIKKLQESFLQTGRLDSEYYLPCYEDYVHLVEHYRGGYGQFASVCTTNEANYVPSENEEYTYIELGNIGSYGDITGCTVAYGKDLPSRARRVVHTNDVVLSSVEGSLQSCALVTAEYDNAICSTGFYVVRSDVMNPETLLTLFKSEVMQNLFKRNCSGTILTAVNHNELQKIVVPKIRKEVQAEIAENVQKSIALRNEAKSLLENAKLQAENTIQTGGGMSKALLEQSVYYFRLAQWLLLQELLLDYWKSRGAVNCSVKSFSAVQSTGRLDAEYYQPKYDEIENAIKSYKGGYFVFGKTIEYIFTGEYSEEYKNKSDDLIFYIRSLNMKNGRIETDDTHYVNPADFKKVVKTGNIITARVGTIGVFAEVDKSLDNAACSDNILCFNFPAQYNPAVYTMLLNSKPIFELVDRLARGSVQQRLNQETLKDLILPILPKSNRLQSQRKSNAHSHCAQKASGFWSRQSGW